MKLMLVVIPKELQAEPTPVYGKGETVRDRLVANELVRALLRMHADGTVGETYNIVGQNQKLNIEVFHAICGLLDELQLAPDLSSYHTLIAFVTERPSQGHRLTIYSPKIEHNLGPTPDKNSASDLQKTEQCYFLNINRSENKDSSQLS